MLMDLHMASSTVNTVLTNMINENSMMPSNIDQLRAEAIKLQSQMKNTSVDKIMMMLMVEGMIAPYIGNDARMFDFFMNSLLNFCGNVHSTGFFKRCTVKLKCPRFGVL